MGIMNKKKGLRTTPYCTQDELIQYLKLCSLRNELDVTASETREPNWKKWLRCASGLITKVTNERIRLIEAKQLKPIIRRQEHTVIKMVTSDNKKMPIENHVQEEVTVAFQDLLDVVDLATNSCAACPQGECVKDCFYKKVFFRLNMPVCRDDPKEGECPFSWLEVGETKQIVPQNKRLSHYFAEDYYI